MADDEMVCQLCWQGSEVESITGELHAEQVDAGKVISAHHRCMQYSSGLTQYKCQVFGGFDVGEVEEEIIRGNKLRCFICRKTKGKKSRGATSGCAVKSCRKTFHFVCASTHPDVVTKRLLITKNKSYPDDKYVLYRVFCSSEHEALFRKTLKDDLHRGTRRRTASKKNSENGEETAGSTETEGSAQQSSSEAEKQGGAAVVSPFTRQSPETSEAHSSKSTPITSPQSSISEINHSMECDSVAESSDNTAVTTTMAEVSILLSPTTTIPTSRADVSAVSSPTISSSIEPQKQLSFSPEQTLTRSQGLKAEVSEPLLCRLSEELSCMHHNREGEVGNKNMGSSQGVHGPPVLNGWHSDDKDHLSASPCEESVENKSPDTSHISAKTPVKVIKALTDRLAGGDKGLVLQVHSNNRDNSQLAAGQRGVVLRAHAGRTDQIQPAVGLKNVESTPKRAAVNGKKAVHTVASQNRASKPRQVGKLPSTGKPSQSTSLLNGHNPSQGRTVPDAKDSGMKNVCGENLSPKPAVARKGQEQDIVSNGARSETTDVCESRTEGESSSKEVEDSVDSCQETATSAGQNRSCRRRKRSEHSFCGNAEEPVKKSIKESLQTASDLQQIEGVLLIPSHMDQFQTQEAQVTQAILQRLKVEEEGVRVWQRVTSRLLGPLPSSLMLLFMMDLIKELEKGNNEAVLDLLFDADFLTARLNNYLIAQEHVFQRVGDKQAQQNLQATMWTSLEKNVDALPMVHLVRGDEDLVTLVFDVKHFKLSHCVTANLQAHKGLFGWSEDTAVLTFPLTPSRQGLALQREALTFKAWLTHVNPISEVTILPSDDLLFDKSRSAANDEFFRLAEYLKAKTHTPVLVEGASGEPVQQVVPLLVFQPIQVFLLSFSDYFQRACNKFFHSRGLVSGLVLMPLSNLYSLDCRSIVGLLHRGEVEGDYSVSVYSAFCPTSHPITMVLLEITRVQQPDISMEVADSTNVPQTNVVVKRKRGRPRKSST